MRIDYCINISNDESFEKSAVVVVKTCKPNWDMSKVSVKHYSEGLTNVLVGYYYENYNDQILIRVYGSGTELFIDRKTELENVKILCKYGLAPEILLEFTNGFCYGFTPGNTITCHSVSTEKVYPKVAKIMGSMHQIEMKDHTPKLFSLMRRFIELIPDEFIENLFQRTNTHYFNKEYLYKEVSSMEKVIEEMEKEVVFSHNDLLLNNIILNEKDDTVHIIDYEYASPNYLYYDVANHFCEFAGVDNVDYNLYPDAEFARKFLRSYLSSLHNTPADEILFSDVESARKKTNVMSLASHLFWGSWSVLQANLITSDFSYDRYSAIRFKEYERRKGEFLSAVQ